jgi:hypothetical protein
MSISTDTICGTTAIIQPKPDPFDRAQWLADQLEVINFRCAVQLRAVRRRMARRGEAVASEAAACRDH